MHEQEEWRPIPGFPEYQASSHGLIASVKRGERQILAGGKTDTGYRNVLLYSGGERIGRRVHTLIALTFHGPRPEGLEIRHLDGDQLNNAAANLAYGTREENLEDKRRHRGLLLIVGPDPVPGWAARSIRIPRKQLRTACRKGHPFTEANTYYYPDGRATCRPCKSATESASRRRRAFRAAGMDVAA
jgi:hypothetical protein